MAGVGADTGSPVRAVRMVVVEVLVVAELLLGPGSRYDVGWEGGLRAAIVAVVVLVLVLVVEALDGVVAVPAATAVVVLAVAALVATGPGTGAGASDTSLYV